MQRASSKVEQIIAQIRSLIGTQSFEGGRLPSEPSLAEMVGASRATVRQALAELEVEGLLIRKHGVGTFVNERMLNIASGDEVWDFLEMIEVAGHTSIEHHFPTLGPTMNSLRLGLQPEDEVITTANVFLRTTYRLSTASTTALAPRQAGVSREELRGRCIRS